MSHNRRSPARRIQQCVSRLPVPKFTAANNFTRYVLEALMRRNSPNSLKTINMSSTSTQPARPRPGSFQYNSPVFQSAQANIGHHRNFGLSYHRDNPCAALELPNGTAMNSCDGYEEESRRRSIRTNHFQHSRSTLPGPYVSDKSTSVASRTTGVAATTLNSSFARQKNESFTSPVSGSIE